jgi:hypothetical protein
VKITELQDIINFVKTANKEQLKAFSFLGQWMMDIAPKHCTCSSKCNQNCKIAQNLDRALQTTGKRFQEQ